MYVRFISLFLLFALLAPTAQAAELAVAGWIPYWATAKGTKAATTNIDVFTEVNPFAYSVKSDGTLADTANIKKSDWKRLFTAAEKNNVAVIPTIMWSDRANIERILKDPALRAKHVAAVATMVSQNGFDGVDIDYENKSAATRVYFSLFLKELRAKLKDKVLSCTIEARTPPDSLYRTVPANLEYANDYKEINAHCDQVRIMAYDQQTADWKLNSIAEGAYAPLSDVRWVKKVLDLAAKDISRDKLVLGIPTYGHEYEITVSPTGSRTYKKLWAFNPKYATDIAKKQKITPARDLSGELSFTYSTKKQPKSLVLPLNVSSARLAEARAVAEAKKTGKSVTYRVMWWSDAGAVKQKIDLARSMDLAGIAIFKIDGAADTKIWGELRKI